MSDQERTTTTENDGEAVIEIPLDVLRQVRAAWFEPGRTGLSPQKAVESLMQYLPPEPDAALIEVMAESAWDESADYQSNGAPWSGVAERAKEEYRREMREALAAIRLQHYVVPAHLLDTLRANWWGKPGESVESANQAMRALERLMDGDA